MTPALGLGIVILALCTVAALLVIRVARNATAAADELKATAIAANRNIELLAAAHALTLASAAPPKKERRTVARPKLDRRKAKP